VIGQFDNPELTIAIDASHDQFSIVELCSICRIETIVAAKLLDGFFSSVRSMSQRAGNDFYRFRLSIERAN
jgi:uncharacterized protein YbjQ (UPF0145 family)